MIKIYKSGEELLKENFDYLKEDVNLSSFFFIDAPLLTKTDNINYALLCETNNKKLLALKLEPYNMLLYGDLECINEFVSFIISNNYEIKNIFCKRDLGLKLIDSLLKYNLKYEEELTMDFMIANNKTYDSCKDVRIANLNDLETIYNYIKKFNQDCGLDDVVLKDKIKESISSFRVYDVNGEIASIAKYAQSYYGYVRISDVYTLDKYRGKGYASKVVNALKNEIIDNGLIPTLNVDRKNPISNHIYRKLGFKEYFSQSIFRKEN